MSTKNNIEWNKRTKDARLDRDNEMKKINYSNCVRIRISHVHLSTVFGDGHRIGWDHWFNISYQRLFIGPVYVFNFQNSIGAAAAAVVVFICVRKSERVIFVLFCSTLTHSRSILCVCTIWNPNCKAKWLTASQHFFKHAPIHLIVHIVVDSEWEHQHRKCEQQKRTKKKSTN